jgi:AAA domain
MKQGSQQSPQQAYANAQAQRRNKFRNSTSSATAAAPPADLDEWNAGEDPGTIPPRQWLLGNQFCCGFISSIVSAGGGKSALRLLQLISLAVGRPLCGQYVFRRCRVLLISLEDDRDELQRRIKAVLDHYGIKRSELDGWLFCAAPKLTKLAQLNGKARIVGPLEKQLRDAIKRRKPDIVSLDPFVKTHALEENSSGDMDFVCDLLARFAVEFGIAVDSPHHVHKGMLTPGDANSGRGSSGIRDAGRLIYTLSPMAEEEAEAFGIAPADRHAYVRLDSAKVNITEKSGKPTWFRVIGVPIGNATTEYPAGDTIQVVEPWQPPNTWAGISPVTLNLVLGEIDQGLANGQRYSSEGPAKARAAWLVVARYCPTKPEGQCREIIRAWLKSGLLYTLDYEDPVDRKPGKGLYVDAAKKPSV